MKTLLAFLAPGLLACSLLLSGCGAGTTLQGDPPTPFTVGSGLGLGVDRSNVAVKPYLQLAFSSPVDEQSAAQGIELKDAAGKTVPVRIVTAGYYVGISTVNDLGFEQTYTLTVSNVRSTNGAALQNSYTTTFLTEKAPLTFKITLTGANTFGTAQIQTVIQNLSGMATGQVWFTASCQESGYPNLSTTLTVGRTGFAVNEAVSSPFNYSSGFSYFTGNAVRCSFSGEDRVAKRRVVIAPN